MTRKLLFALLAALVASTAFAQGSGTTVARDFYAGFQYDVDSTNLYYCTTQGPNVGKELIMSTGGGSSATLIPSVSSSAPFTGMAVGDVLVIKSLPPDVSTYSNRVITTWTSANSIVVDGVITLASGTSFSWYRNTCGTAITSGWFAIPANAQRVGMTVQFEQGDIATLSARWECKPTNTWDIVIIYPGESSDCGLGGTLSTDRCDFAQAVSGTATGSLTIVDDAPVFGFCRVGLAYKTSDTADTTTNLEKITVSVAIR